MVRRLARRLLRPVRRFNRWWIDRLDPDWPGQPEVHEPARPADVVRAAEPVAPAPAPAAKARTEPIAVWAEATPNPHAVKYVCSVPVVDAPVTWRAGDRTSDPLGQALLSIPGVKSAFAVGDFVTVTRDHEADWDLLTAAVEHAIQTALG